MTKAGSWRLCLRRSRSRRRERWSRAATRCSWSWPRPWRSPCPASHRRQQAREALRILDRAAELPHTPTHAYHLRRAACLDRCGDAERANAERLAAAEHQAGRRIRPFPERVGAATNASSCRKPSDISTRPADAAESFLGAVPVGDLRPQVATSPARGRPSLHLTSCLQNHQDLALALSPPRFRPRPDRCRGGFDVPRQIAEFELAEADYQRGDSCATRTAGSGMPCWRIAVSCVFRAES